MRIMKPDNLGHCTLKIKARNSHNKQSPTPLLRYACLKVEVDQTKDGFKFMVMSVFKLSIK